MRIRSPLLVKCLSRSGIAGMRGLFASCRVRIVGDPAISLYDQPTENFLYSAWHDAILISLLCRRPARNTAALVSQHRDGDWVTEVLRAVNVKPVRGSTSKGGARALREMLDVTRENHVCITSDGPRGPRREVKSGLVFLAAKTGCRIIPAGYACRRAWRIKGSWTDMQIPKPFTTIYAVGSDPISVPRKLGRDGLEHYTRLLQAGMDDANGRAEAYAAGETPTDVILDGVEQPPRMAA